MLICYHQIGFTNIISQPDDLEMIGTSMIGALAIFVLVTSSIIVLIGLKKLQLKWKQSRFAKQTKVKVNESKQMSIEDDDKSNPMSERKKRRALFVA